VGCRLVYPQIAQMDAQQGEEPQVTQMDTDCGGVPTQVSAARPTAGSALRHRPPPPKPVSDHTNPVTTGSSPTNH